MAVTYQEALNLGNDTDSVPEGQLEDLSSLSS